ncbi:MAG: hypothetical protein JSR58_07675 [Verrucomicrobia bacterium]|nr:hypothetical protein [Verrucomicrobiota bacterium]
MSTIVEEKRVSTPPQAPAAPIQADAAKSHALAQTILAKQSLTPPLGAVKPPKSLLAADGPMLSVMDISSATLNSGKVASEWVESYDPTTDLSQPLMGMTQGLYLAANTALTVEGVKRAIFANHIGDTEGQRLALASLGMTVPLVGAGATALAEKSLKVYDMVRASELIDLEPISGVTDAAAGLGVATMLLIGLQKVCLGFTAAYNMYRKSELEDELLAHPDRTRDSKIGESPFVEDTASWMNSKLDITKELSTYTEKDFTNLALDEGEKWFSKLEKEWKKMGIDTHFQTPRREIVLQLFINQPEKMAQYTGIKGAKGLELMVAFGKKLMSEKLRAGKEQELGRHIGQALVDKHNRGEHITKKEILAELDKGFDRHAWQILLSILTVGVIATVFVLTGGVGALLVSIMFAISALLWMYGLDGTRLYTQWNGEQKGKFDKALLIFSSLLNIIAIGGSIAASIIFSGGIALIPLIILLTVGSFWGVINIRGIQNYWRHTQTPWKYEKVVSLNSFCELVKKEEDDKIIKIYFDKMHELNKKLFEGRQDWKQATVDVLAAVKIAKEEQLRELHKTMAGL